MLTMLLNGQINFEGMLEFRGAPCLIPRPSQVLADLLATGDGVWEPPPIWYVLN
jgi:hypothetical protein